MTRALELAGRAFAELTVLRFDGKRGGARFWLCQCSCGKQVSVAGSKIVSGHTKSCGHIQSKGVPPTHGGSQSREYNIWTHILQRCYNPKRDNYPRYGGRGIKVCDRWRHDYAAFLSDMGLAPFDGAQIDRIDNDGDYTPENCRWVSQDENKRNKPSTRRIAFGDVEMTVMEWSKKLGVPVNTLNTRLARGWTGEECLSGKRAGEKVPNKSARWITHNGETLTLTQWANRIGTPMKTLHRQLSRGWSIGDVIKGPRNRGNENAEPSAT